jgi:hypothetical protein
MQFVFMKCPAGLDLGTNKASMCLMWHFSYLTPTTQPTHTLLQQKKPLTIYYFTNNKLSVFF